MNMSSSAEFVALESLPTELLQRIFVYSKNFDLPLVSKTLFHALSYHENLAIRTLEEHCVWLPEFPIGTSQACLFDKESRFMNQKDKEENRLQYLKRKEEALTMYNPTSYCLVMDSAILERKFITERLIKKLKFLRDDNLRFLPEDIIPEEVNLRYKYWDIRRKLIDSKLTIDKETGLSLDRGLVEYEVKRAIIKNAKQINAFFPKRLTITPFTEENLSMINYLWNFNITFKNLSKTLSIAINDFSTSTQLQESSSLINIDETSQNNQNFNAFSAFQKIMGLENFNYEHHRDYNYISNDFKIFDRFKRVLSSSDALISSFNINNLLIADCLYYFMMPCAFDEKLMNFLRNDDSGEYQKWIDRKRRSEMYNSMIQA